MNRRTVLTRIAAVAGGIGLAFGSIPFIRYFMPSEKAKALGAAVSVDLSNIQPGELRSVEWRGQPVLIFRRTEEQLASLRLTDSKVLDKSNAEDAQPPYVDSEYRSINPEFLVLLGNCTHLGCVPLRDTDTGKKLLGNWWPGGFHCPCHDSLYDNAGRVVRGPAPSNLRVPPHYFASANNLVIGSDAVDT